MRGPVAYDSLRRVCIRAPNWVGDAVMATPALRAVRAHLPGARVTIVVASQVEPVLRAAPWFDEWQLYGPRGRWVPGEFLRCAGAIRRGRCELGLVLPNSFSSALMMLLAGVSRRVGYARDCRTPLLTDAMARPSESGHFRPTYMVDYYLDLCDAVGIPPAGRQMELFHGAEDLRLTDHVLRRQGLERTRGLFLLHPGAGFGPSKRWPAERFARLAELLADHYGSQIAIIGGPAEHDTANSVRAASRARIADLSDCGVDLHLLKCVVSRSKLLVTTDSGPRHYGIAFGVPTVCVMGPTHPGYSTSTLPHDHVVRLDVECGPCQEKECPSDHRCMRDITPEMVLAACQRALSLREEARTP